MEPPIAAPGGVIKLINALAVVVCIAVAQSSVKVITALPETRELLVRSDQPVAIGLVAGLVVLSILLGYGALRVVGRFVRLTGRLATYSGPTASTNKATAVVGLSAVIVATVTLQVLAEDSLRSTTPEQVHATVAFDDQDLLDSPPLTRKLVKPDTVKSAPPTANEQPAPPPNKWRWEAATRKAAAEGNADAQYRLGQKLQLLQNSESEPENERKRRLTEVSYWYHLAAEQGHAEAQYILGLHGGFNKLGVDEREGLEWLRKAMRNGHAPAKFALRSRTSNPESYEQWLRGRAEQGDADAAYALASAAWILDVIAKDPKNAIRAARLLRKAAERGHVNATVELGSAYAFGDGVPQDEKEALVWWRRAAELGSPSAPTLLAIAYAKPFTTLGLAGPNHVEALKWALIAARNSRQFSAEMERAVETQEELAPKLTPEQIAQAQSLARAWKKPTATAAAGL